MKHVNWKFLPLGLAAVLGCSRFDSTPKKSLSQYMAADLKGNLAAAYTLLSSNDRSSKTLKEYQEEESLGAAFKNAMQGRSSYMIKDVVEEKATAKATVAVTMPNPLALVGDAMASAFSGKSPDVESMAKKSNAQSVPLITQDQTFELVKEPDGWKVYLGWDKELQKKAAEEDQKKKEIDARAEYMKQSLRLVDFKVGEGTARFSTEAEPGIFGKVVNKGNRTLKKIKITVFFLGSDGKPIGEKDYYPLIITGFGFSSEKPMKPGYVKDFGFVVKSDAPADWSGKVRADISEIEFVE